jgi:hypothetical protein
VSRGQVVDFHVHAFPPEVEQRRERFAALDAGFAALYSSPKARIATADAVLTEMAAAEVDHSVLLGFGWSDPGLCREHTAYLCDAARANPDRLTAFAALQPRDPRASAAVAGAATLGARGIGELMPHLQGYALDDESTIGPMAEAAAALGLIVLTHASEPVGHAYPGKGDVSPRTLLAFVRRWPELRVVAAHWGGGLAFYELMPEVAEATRRLWYDAAASPLLYHHQVYQSVVDITGPERVLFGSDYPLLGQARCLRRLRASGLAPEALARVVGGNAVRLLGLANDGE